MFLGSVHLQIVLYGTVHQEVSVERQKDTVLGKDVLLLLLLLLFLLLYYL